MDFDRFSPQVRFLHNLCHVYLSMANCPSCSMHVHSVNYAAKTPTRKQKETDLWGSGGLQA